MLLVYKSLANYYITIINTQTCITDNYFALRKDNK